MHIPYLKEDLNAGFSVALVALPLSIGIALASGAPASAGIIAAVIGGLFGSWLGGCRLTINGPAAGLIVIVLDAITNLGFQGMLAAAVVAGAIQIIFGYFKLARKCAAFPASVIHGMMAAIGLIIIAKQVHILVGYTPIAKNPLLLYAEIPQAILNMNPLVATIGVICLVFMIGWNKLPFKWSKKLPVSLMSVILGALLAKAFGVGHNTLLQIPKGISSWIAFPEFSAIGSYLFWKTAITLCLVGSLETVLSASAVDKMDPEKQTSNHDRDLMSKGVCNMLSAIIGGLPMIAEIVRSSANIGYGAKTAKANFFHGAIILIAVSLFPGPLNLIPLAALAGVLILVGFRLGNPDHFVHAKRLGVDNLIGFATTLALTLSVDLLVGIFVGALAQFAAEIFFGLKPKNIFKANYKIGPSNANEVQIEIESALACSNFVGLKEKIRELGNQNNNVTLIMTKCSYVDHSVMECLNELEKFFTFKKLILKTVFSDHHQSIGKDRLSAVRLVA